MDEIDLGFQLRHGLTIYRLCFDKYNTVRYQLNEPEEKWLQLIPKIEETFFWLVKEHQKHLPIEKVNRFIEQPDLNGETCFHNASQCSLKISKYILSKFGTTRIDQTLYTTQHITNMLEQIIRNA